MNTKIMDDFAGALLDPDRLDPLQAKALEMWRAEKFQWCCNLLCELEGELLTDWDCYNQMCVDCDEHNICFGGTDES
jgi:hypothetical protein